MSGSYSSTKQHFPAPYKRRRYYTPQEVRQHNTANDCWVSFFNEVYDLTNLIQMNYSSLVDPLIKRAGTDISDWFDSVTRDVINNSSNLIYSQKFVLSRVPVIKDISV
jgi:cytochrome b involved in lipid metabolism